MREVVPPGMSPAAFMRTVPGKEVSTVRAVRKINNNVVTCVDADGNELIAMGRGIGFGKLPRDLSLAEIDRTFYDVGSRYISAASELPEEMLEFAAKIVDVARNQLSYDLSPNLTFILADHIAYAVERAKKGIYVRMPMAYDVEQSYPAEVKLGRFAVRRIEKEFGVTLPREEAAGIALNLANARVADDADVSDETTADDRMLEDVTEIIEERFAVVVDRDSFAFSRYATHMLYLFERLRKGENLESVELGALAGMREQFPQGVEAADAVAAHIAEKWGRELSEDEKLYLVIHISRICR